jgi:hypothetical protein
MSPMVLGVVAFDIALGATIGPDPSRIDATMEQCAST